MGSFIQLPADMASRQIQKHALTLEEVEFSLGKKSLVKELREIGALEGKQEGRTILFQAPVVARVAAEYFAGDYDNQLARLRS